MKNSPELRQFLKKMELEADSYIGHVRRIVFQGTADEVMPVLRKRYQMKSAAPEANNG